MKATKYSWEETSPITRITERCGEIDRSQDIMIAHDKVCHVREVKPYGKCLRGRPKFEIFIMRSSARSATRKCRFEKVAFLKLMKPYSFWYYLYFFRSLGSVPAVVAGDITPDHTFKPVWFPEGLV